MASYTPGVKEILRAHGCHFERPGKGDHEVWVETSWYREAILTCVNLQRSCVSFAKNAIH
jgi:hypothetical protein